MQIEKSSDLASNYPLVAEHFVPRPFRSKVFLLATAAFCGIPINILLWDFKVVHNPDFEVVMSQLMAILILAFAWWQTLKIYTSIHRLFYDRKIENFGEHSAIAKVLKSAYELIVVMVWVITGAISAMSAMFQLRH